ncbi:MAG TPA: DUF5615 family PIN-like protein [Longimicrobium sp.]|jgi:predicted nuclease of predicted toxin-antitoxin system
MRVLLDEQIDHRLKPLFDAGFTVVTVQERGWGSMKDGALLRATQAEFDALVTMDRGIPHQQKVQSLSLGIIVVRAVSNRRADVAPLIPRVNDALRAVGPGQVV